MDCFKDYDFWIMDISIDYFYCYYTAWNEVFLLNFVVGVGFCWRTVSTYFWVENPGGCRKSRFPEDLRMGKLDGETFVLRCVYFFVYLLFVCLLFIYFKGAVCWVMHESCGLAPLEGGGRWGWLFMWSFVAVLLGLLRLIVFSCGFDAGRYEKLAFTFNLLLLLPILIYIIVKYGLCVKTSVLIWYANRCTGFYLEVIIR